jgi:hypothetical protein
MGLDTDYDCWHGSYGAFNWFRTALAIAAGLPLVTEGQRVPCIVPIAEDRFKPQNYQGEWDEYPDDPLVVLLVHSDCDGVLPADIVGPLADRLAGIRDKLPDGPEWDSWRPRCDQFIAGLRAARADGNPVEFC